MQFLRHPSRVVVALVVLSSLTLAKPATAQPDYGGYRPHYQGYGVNTPGGRGGVVYRVTNLNDSGTGSLRAAVTTPGARFVIFDVSGTIRLSSPLLVNHPYITIAGQTAPSPGIAIRGPGVIVDTHDVVLQHLRIRVGALPYEPHALWIRNDATNVVVDHVSLSWSVWTSLAVSSGSAGHPNGNVTIIDSLVAEALACSGVNSAITCDPASYPQRGWANSKGVLMGDGWGHPAQNIAMIRTISANNNERHPEVAGRTNTVLVNNLIYNPSSTPLSAISYHDGFRKGAHRSVVVGNLLLPGPTTPGHNGYVAPEYREEGRMRMIRVHPSVTSDTRIFLSGNYFENDCNGTACLANPSAQWALARDTKWDWEGVNVRASSPPLTLANLPLTSAMPYTAVEAFVTSNAGARPLDRDVVDRRIIAEISARSGSVPNRPSEKAGAGTGSDGFPILAVNTRALTIPTNPNAAADASGRTTIELWLESLARALEPAHAAGAGARAPQPPNNLRVLSH